MFTLLGCNNRAETQIITPEPMVELKPMQQSYRGVLPCADCEGIETSLFLNKEGTWVMDQTYLGKNSSFASYGTWARTADKLVLTAENGDKIYFLAKDDSLEKLDTEGNPIQSSLNYTLRAVEAPLPTTPMSMKGEYTYYADAAVFADCATGRTFPVESNAVLQEEYLEMRGKDLKPVFLQFDAHFAVQPKPDSDKLEKVLVSDGQAKFTPGKSCKD